MTLTLSAGKRYLENLLKKNDLPVKKYRRVTALLELDRGRTFTEVAKIVGMTSATMSTWAKKYKNAGLAFLIDNPKPGRPPLIDGLQRAKITALACSQPPEGYEKWSLRLGSLGTQGQLNFIFDRKGVFRLTPEAVGDPDEMELELIDFGLEKLEVDEEEAVIYTDYLDFGRMAKALEERGIETIKAQLERIPTTFSELNEEQTDQILELIDKFEEDDDVQAVYHNLK